MRPASPRWFAGVVMWLVCTIACTATARAQPLDVVNEPPPPPGVRASLDSVRAVRGLELDVALATFGPGDAIFERFGHNALVITDRSTGESLAYNWGMFDFNQPNFLGRFLTGDTRYWLGVFRTEELFAAYRADNRSIRVQRLALTPVERAAVLEFVTWNQEGENAFYRYDYYRDNCSSRVRDVLDYVLRGALRQQLNRPGAGVTWRSETRRILTSSLPAYAGIQVALGKNADRELTLWEEGFLPEHLANALLRVRLESGDGRSTRLVVRDSTVFRAQRAALPSEPPMWLSLALLTGMMFAGLVALMADARSAVVRALLVGGIGTWYLLLSVGGIALLLAGTVTHHAPYMGANSSLLVMNPLALAGIVAVPRALWRREQTRWSLVVAVALALFAAAAVLAQLIPALRQQNGEVLAVMVPVQIAVAFAIYRLSSPHDAVAPEPLPEEPQAESNVDG